MYESGPVPVQRPASLEARLFEGSVIADRYRVDQLIAEGGMGLVFRGRHLILDQPIALKIVRPSFAHHPVAVARFLDEARAIARLKSPHVAHVFDSGTVEDGPPYMVLELLDGWDLRSVLEREGPLSFERAAGYVIQACQAVSEAHALGIIHRDLKPENLFLHRAADGSPVIKVLDFGISKRLNPGDGRSYTVEGETLGSPHYMAPEQMSAARLDERVDIWALGVVLFELVTGRVPFQGDNIAQVCSSLLSQEAPPVSSIRREVPQGFEEVVDRCLKKTPAERYGHVDELAEALRSFINGTAPSTAPPISYPKSALDSTAPTLISVAPPATERRGTSSARGSTGTRFAAPSLVAAFAACVTIAALVGLKSYLPPIAQNGIPLSAESLLMTTEKAAPDPSKPTPAEQRAIENAVFVPPLPPGPFVEPKAVDAVPRTAPAEEGIVVTPVPGTRAPLKPIKPVPQQVPVGPTTITRRIDGLADLTRAPRLAPPSVSKHDSGYGDPPRPIVPVKRGSGAPANGLDELIPPYQPRTSDPGAEPNDSDSKQYF